MPRHSAAPQPAWLRPRLVVAFVVAAAGLATAVWLPTRNDSADASERNRTGSDDSRDDGRSDARSSFDDEFRGDRGSTVDPAKWSLDTGGADNGLEFRESTRNARLDGDGNLEIVLRERERDGDRDGLTSARLVTRDLLRADSGRVEARIKTPEGVGLRPAFELIGAEQEGIGSFDVLRDERSGDFHTYAVDWVQNEAVFSVDGEEVDRIKQEGLGMDRPFRLALSLAAGDNRSGDDLPARMLVDSVSLSAEGDRVPPSTEPTEPPATTPPTTPPTTEPTAAPTTTPPTKAPPVAKAWKPFTIYVAGQLVTFKGIEYQVQETHTSLPGWEPTALPSLFKKM